MRNFLLIALLLCACKTQVHTEPYIKMGLSEFWDMCGAGPPFGADKTEITEGKTVEVYRVSDGKKCKWGAYTFTDSKLTSITY